MEVKDYNAYCYECDIHFKHTGCLTKIRCPKCDSRLHLLLGDKMIKLFESNKVNCPNCKKSN